MERKLASIRRVNDIRPIEGADAIECVVIDGWEVVAKKKEFKVGDLVAYLEIDSWVPTELAPFLSKGKEPREFNGVKGERLRTVKLRGQLSQGLVLPLAAIFEYLGSQVYDVIKGYIQEGYDLTELLGIQKWEAPVNAQLAGQAKSTFPTHMWSKSDQERAQNLGRTIFDKHYNDQFEVSLKLDGSSISVFNTGEEVGVASRNLWLKIEENPDNAFVKTAAESNLLCFMKDYPGVLVQGELMGPGIQGNREGLTEHTIFIYNVQRNGHKFLSPTERAEFIKHMPEKVKHVPILHERITLAELGIKDMNDLKAFSKQKSMNHPVAEGFVFKSHDSDLQFKIINDEFLLKGGD